MKIQTAHNEPQPTEIKAPMNKSTKFLQLLAAHGTPTPHRGRPFRAFTTDPETKTFLPHSREAYALRFHQVKLLVAIDQGYEGNDPLAAVKLQLGGVRRTLWLFLYERLPTFPGKEEKLTEFKQRHGAFLLGQGIEDLILEKISSGEISDTAFAARVLDDGAFLNFADSWLNRSTGNRAKAIRAK
jgi:hypothetical protein